MLRALIACAVLLSTASTFGQSWPCESPNNGYRECRMGASGKIRLVMEMSHNACVEGVTWGTRSDGVVWVDRGCRATFKVEPAGGSRIVCESQNGTRELCPADTSKGVALAQQLSKTACLVGESWGFDPDRDLIWVDRGCRAELILGRPAEPIRLPQTLDAPVTCESENGRRKECAADTTAGVQIVETLDDKPCRYGLEWGYDAKGIWVTKGCRATFVVRDKAKPLIRAIACESRGKARTECPAETRFGVAIARYLGEEECTLDKTWGFDANGVWVSKGCRAQFALGGYRLPPEAVPASAMKMVCESLDGTRKDCDVEITRGVGLVRQLSKTDCVLNRSWGYDRAGIWVTDGCRAEFAVAR